MAGFGGGGECFYNKINVMALIVDKVLRFECFAGFAERLNEMGIGLLGRHGFFELFDEIIFDQRNKLFRLKLPEMKTSIGLFLMKLRGVAQGLRAPALGAGGRAFKSRHPEIYLARFEEVSRRAS